MRTILYLETWNKWGQLAAYALIAIAILILFYHFVSLLLKRDYKKRYDFINKHEINNLWYASVEENHQDPKKKTHTKKTPVV
jgi:hypothetical protein